MTSAAAKAPTLPAWLKRRTASAGVALLSLALLLLAGVFIGLEFRQQELAAGQQNELYVRTLDSEVRQTLAGAEAALLGLMQSKAGQAKDAKDAQAQALNTALAAALSKVPAVRSFSLLDAQGLVLASSSPGNVGRSVSLSQLQLQGQALPAGLGRLLAGRDLADLNDLRRALAPLPATPSSPSLPLTLPLMLPLTLAQHTEQGPRFWVAVLKPEHFAARLDRLLEGQGQNAALLSLDGQLIAANQGRQWEPEKLANNHLVFKAALPHRQRGSYSATGLFNAQKLGGQELEGQDSGGGSGASSMGSFLHVTGQPLVLLVELPTQQLWARMLGYAQAILLMTLLGLALMVALGATAWRGLGAYEQAKRELLAAHQSLAAKEREQSLLIQNVQELMFHTDANGVLQFINQANFLGAGNSQPYLGQPFERLIDARDQAKARGLFQRTTGFLNLPVILRLVAQDGHQRVLEVVVTAVQPTEVAVAGFVGFGLDVTEREDARQRLQSQLDFTARLIDVCPIPIFAKDHALRFVMVNQAWSDMTGLDKDLALGRKLSELRPASLAAAVELQDARLLAQGGSEHIEIRERGRDFLTHRAVFTDASGAIAGLLGSAIDISRFVEAERQIGEARDAAERANSIKTEFVANMSHELRTPLQSIIGFSELGVNRSGDHARLQDMFARIHSSGQRMLELVNNLLDLSRLESTIGQLILTEQELAPLITAVVDEHAGAADKRSIRLSLAMPAQALRAAVDAGRLQQALRNVLDNALRLAPAASQVTVQLDQDGAQLCISVHDLGPGIPPAELESIFTPFAQSSQTKQGAGGTGLGLAVCRKIMVAHGGGVTASNHVGGGAVFELRLPIS
ncbi:sensor histidine kinase [Roseateles sp.]|uniref:sensor histidine kinase n=1 Tax=Roseateles sp. TaxID=1971397 RepID=UPI00286CA2B4|nr:ATP-binding protein [Roseateles sp.]